MWVTLYTDASFDQERGGAWAVWIRSARGRIVKSGSCPRYVDDSTAAELAAVYAGIYIAVREWGEEVSGVLVRSDCHGALALAQGTGRPPRRRSHRRLQTTLRALLEEHRIELACRWVRGHQPKHANLPAWLNAQCDRLARKRRLRRAARRAS